MLKTLLLSTSLLFAAMPAAQADEMDLRTSQSSEVNDERADAVMASQVVQSRLTTLRASLIHNHKWTNEIRSEFYAAQQTSVSLQETIDNPRAEVPTIQHRFNRLSASFMRFQRLLNRVISDGSQLDNQLTQTQEKFDALRDKVTDIQD